MTNLELIASEINNYLIPYQQIWEEEIMNLYPESIEFYPKEWLEILNSLNESEIYQIDCKEIPHAIENTTLAQFIRKLKTLTEIKFKELPSPLLLENWAFNQVKEKKKHEINCIAPLLKNLFDKNLFKRVIDIGGGVGHFSRVLSHYYKIPTISLDKNKNFQEIGQERLKKYRKLEGHANVKFINHEYKKYECDKEKLLLQNIYQENSFLFGLHACGPLSVKLVKHTVQFKTKGLLSFGCCYYTQNKNEDFPISNFYKKKNFFSINSFGLSLATRSHAPMELKDFITKKNVKYFRYALHLFLIKYFQNKFFTDVGESPLSIYSKPFSLYIHSKLQQLNLTHNFSMEFFDKFYHDIETQRELKTMWFCNIIRWQLGRALEISLLLDRAIYLEENGYNVEMKQFFQEEISPRNIGILATLKNH